MAKIKLLQLNIVNKTNWLKGPVGKPGSQDDAEFEEWVGLQENWIFRYTSCSASKIKVRLKLNYIFFDE